MAISRVDVATAASSAAVSSQQITVPAGVQAGDVLVLTAAMGVTQPYATLAGWTNVVDFVVLSAACRIGVWYRVAQSGDASSTVTVTASSGSGTAAAQMLVYRGVDTTSPMDATPVTAHSEGLTGTDVAAPAVVTSTADAVVISVHALPTAGGVVWDGSDVTDPSGATNEVVACATSGSANNALVATYEYAAATPGTYGPFVATIPAARRWGAVTLALRAHVDTLPPTPGGGGWGFIPIGGAN